MASNRPREPLQLAGFGIACRAARSTARCIASWGMGCAQTASTALRSGSGSSEALWGLGFCGSFLFIGCLLRWFRQQGFELGASLVQRRGDRGAADRKRLRDLRIRLVFEI